MSDVFTTKESAIYIKITLHTLRELAREGKIPTQKVGGELSFLKSALDRWLEGDVRWQE